MRPLMWSILLFAVMGSIARVAANPPLVQHGYADYAAQLARQGAQALEEEAYDTARSLLEQALLANPGSADVLRLLGRLELRAGRTRHAQRLLDAALAIAPRDANNLLWAGRIALARADGGLANDHLAQLQSVCAECPQAHELAEAITAADASGK